MGRTLCLLLLSAALVTSACTSDDDSPAATSSTTTTTTTAVSAYERLSLPNSPPSCAEAAASNDPADLVGAFVAAQLAGRGAEGCLTDEALGKFSDDRCDESSLESDPGPSLLYRCGDRPVVAIPNDLVQAARTDHRTVQTSVFVAGSRQRGQPQHLTIGPGTPLGADQPVRQVIVDVSAI